MECSGFSSVLHEVVQWGKGTPVYTIYMYSPDLSILLSNNVQKYVNNESRVGFSVESLR